MRSMFTALVLAITVLYSCGSYAQKGMDTESEQKPADPRFLFLDGVIMGQTIGPLQDALVNIIASKSRKAVTIVINSPGGGVIAGMSFVNKMQTIKALDIEINCYVLDVAASMAFQILTQCTNRYAMPTSFLLWHGVRMQTGQPITVTLARQIAEDLQRMDNLVQLQLGDALSMNSSDIQKHFDNETLWSGYELNFADPHFLTLMSSYPRLLPKLDSAVQMAPAFFFFGQVEEGYQYIWDGYAEKIAAGQ